MQIHYSLDTVPKGLSSAITIGKFDGVHLGHQMILEKLSDIAAEEQLTSVIITFDRHPLEIIAPEHCPMAVTSLEQKTSLLSLQRVDYLIILHFDEARKDQPAEEFIQELVEYLGAKHLIVGQDFRFGQGGSGTVEMLTKFQEKYDYILTVVEDISLTNHRDPRGQHRISASLETDEVMRISSSKIRELLAVGDVRAAAKMLGRNHYVSGTVVHGAKRGRELGFPTANLQEVPEGLVPKDGIYAGWLIDEDIRYKAAISVGENPTFNDVFHKQVEAYLPDVSLDLYDKEVRIEFVDRIRPMLSFESVDALVTQMTDDVQQVLNIL